MENRINSIQYYALDVLRYIFEYTIYGVSPAECFKTATSLSHVCRQWRMAALDTPRLWEYIHCDMGKEDKAIKDFWERTPSRVRGFPTTVRISNVGTYRKIRVRHLKLEAIPNIDQLTIQVHNAKGIKELNHRCFTPPTGLLNQLHIVRGFEPVYGEWNCNPLLKRFPPMMSLKLKGVSGISFGGKEVFPNLTSLSLHEIRFISIEIINSTFPSLQRLDFCNSYFQVCRPVVFSHLEYLRIDHQQPLEWLTKLSCPVLSHVLITNGPDSDRLVRRIGAENQRDIAQFFVNHPLITSLELPLLYNISELATRAPRIHHLRLSDFQGDWWSMERNPIFPSLITLSLEGSTFLFPYMSFEPFVRRRCLPITHPQSLLTTSKPLESLTIYLPQYEKGTEYKWKEHALFKEAKQTVVSNERGVEMSISLTWL
jgi:hypothetical protein